LTHLVKDAFVLKKRGKEYLMMRIDDGRVTAEFSLTAEQRRTMKAGVYSTELVYLGTEEEYKVDETGEALVPTEENE
jgi:hypothetical protein